MKRVGIVVFVLVGAGGLIALLTFHPKPTKVAADPKKTATSSPAVAGDETIAPTSSSAASTGYKDGTYSGSVVTTAYGAVQVQAVVSGGKLTKVNFLEMPNDQPHSQQVTAQAEPMLSQEAIAAQSATIDTVSGATQDTQGFTQSLQTALSQAKA